MSDLKELCYANLQMSLPGNSNVEDSFKHEVFAYSHEIKMFGRHYRTYPHYEHTSQILFVPNQLELFEKLYEWYFYIHGLIDSGLAVDINILN